MSRMENFSPSEERESLDVINSPYTGNCQTTLESLLPVVVTVQKMVHSPCLGRSENLPDLNSSSLE